LQAIVANRFFAAMDDSPVKNAFHAAAARAGDPTATDDGPAGAGAGAAPLLEDFSVEVRHCTTLPLLSPPPPLSPPPH
jgi:hypothetical protein